MTVIQVAGFVAGPVGGYLSDKMGRRRVVMSSMILSGVMVVGMVLAGKSPLFVVFIALIGFFLYGMRSVLQAWAIEVTPRNLAGAGVGVQFGVTSLGSAISPVLFGIVADATSLYTGFYLLAGIILFANLLVFFMPDETAPSAIRGKEVTERNRGPLFRRPAGPSLRRAPPPGSV
jgi:MFS family permease